MNVEDADIAWAERDSSPTRMRSYDPEDRLSGEYDRIHTEQEARSQSRQRRASHASREPREEAVEEVEEVEPVRTHRHGVGPHGTPNETGSRVSSSASSISTVERPPRNRHLSTISRTETGVERAMMEYLDRHPTAISRIEAHRLQHMQTVGSRKVFTGTGIELPDFGGM
jgi:MFS transporter, DHA1 family, multidrug resistance protein